MQLLCFTIENKQLRGKQADVQLSSDEEQFVGEAQIQACSVMTTTTIIIAFCLFVCLFFLSRLTCNSRQRLQIPLHIHEHIFRRQTFKCTDTCTPTPPPPPPPPQRHIQTHACTHTRTYTLSQGKGTEEKGRRGAKEGGMF